MLLTSLNESSDENKENIFANANRIQNYQCFTNHKPHKNNIQKNKLKIKHKSPLNLQENICQKHIPSNNIKVTKINKKKFEEDKKSNNGIFRINSPEKYSILKMREKKNPKFSPYKTTNFLYKNIENYFDNIKNEKHDDFLYLKQRKPIHSLKNVFISHMTFYDSEKNEKKFQLFRDCEIGLKIKKWDRENIRIQYNDIDEDSSDETITTMTNICFRKIYEAAKMVENKSKYIEDGDLLLCIKKNVLNKVI